MIERVNDLYFGNVHVEFDEVKARSGCDGSDSDGEGRQFWAELVVQNELRDADLSEQSHQSNFQN